MIRDTYKGYEINIRREKCKDGSSFLSYDIRRREDNAKMGSGLEFSGCGMPALMNALKILVDEMIDRAALEFEQDNAGEVDIDRGVTFEEWNDEDEDWNL